MKLWGLLLLLGASSVFAMTEYSEWSDSGIHGPKYSEILSLVQKLQSENTTVSEVIDYGKTPKGKTLRMLVVMKKSKHMLERPALIMSGSTHGNEYLNLEDRLPEALLKLSQSASSVSRYLDSGGALVFIPILNPDGYDARTRENSHGVDLNRDFDVAPAGFKGFKETETKLLADKLQEMTLPPYNFRYKISVDYHCCIGALLYPWSYTENSIPVADKNLHVAVGQMANGHLDIEYGTTSQILGYYALGTTKDYYYSRYGTLAFTYEGRYGQENKYFDKHVTWWEEMMNGISDISVTPLFSQLKGKNHPFLKIAD